MIKLRNLDIFLRFLSTLYIGKCPSYQNPNDGWVHMERVFIVKVLASLEFSSTSLAKWGFITSIGRSSQLEDSLGSMELSPRHLLYAGFIHVHRGGRGGSSPSVITPLPHSNFEHPWSGNFLILMTFPPSPPPSLEKIFFPVLIPPLQKISGSLSYSPSLENFSSLS